MKSSQISPYNHTVFPDQYPENPLTIIGIKTIFFSTDLQVILMPSDLSFSSSALLAPKSLLFIDEGLTDRAALVASASPSTEIHYLNTQEDAIAQITQTLQGRSGIDSLQIISHGSSGSLNFANSSLNLATLPSNLTNLRSWKSALTDSADILLYGCEVAQGTSGQAFVNLLAATTGADVAASSDVTGNQSLGGNWDLEVQTGSIEAESIVASNYLETLASPVIQGLPTVVDSYPGIGSVETLLGPAISPNATITDADNPSSLQNGSIKISTVYRDTGLPTSFFADNIYIPSNFGNVIRLDGRKVFYNNKEVAYIRSLYNGNFQVDFTTADATLAAASAVLQSIRYTNPDPRLPDRFRDFQITVTDNTGTATQYRIPITLRTAIDPTTINQTTVLYQANGTSTPDSATASPNGPWLTFQKYGGTPTPTGTATETTFTSDSATYSGYTNYNIVEKQVKNPLTQAVIATVPTIPGTKVNANFPTLDRQAGYAVNFQAALTAEAHLGDQSVNNTGPTTTDRNGDGKGDRAGFSIIVLSEDKWGIELGFWDDRVFAQEDASTQIDKTKYPGVTSPADDHLTLFTSAEFASLNTTISRNYEVVIKGNLYTLLADGVAVLSGRLRDYSTVTASLPPNPTLTALLNLGYTENQILTLAGLTRSELNPYDKGSFVFLGDNTSDASATLKISQISITQPGQLSNTSLTIESGKPVGLPKFNISNLDTSTPTIDLTSTKGTINIDTTVIPAGNITRNGKTVTIANATIAQINQLLNTINGITYTSDANHTGADTLTLTTKNGTTLNTTFTFNITNTPPLVRLNQRELLWRNEATGDIAMQYFNGMEYVTSKYIYRGSESSGVKAFGLTRDWTIRATQDFNGDGKADVLWRHSTFGSIVLWEMNGNIITQSKNFFYKNPNNTQTLINTPPNWDIIDLGMTLPKGTTELKPGIFIQDKTTGEMVIWQYNGNEIFVEGSAFIGLPNQPIRPGAIWKAIQIADFNNDQASDILFQHQTLGTLVTWTLQGGIIQAIKDIGTLSPQYQWSVIATGQFTTGDTQRDLLWYHSLTGQVAFDKMKDGLALQSVGNLGPTSNPTLGKPIAVQDFDGDGKPDLLWYNTSTRKLAIWSLDNLTVNPVPESAIKLPAIPVGWTIAGIADFTGNPIAVE